MKKEKIIVGSMLLLLTLGAVFLYLFGHNFQQPKTLNDQLIDIRKSIESITHKKEFYNSEEEVFEIFEENKKFLKTDLDLFFSDINNFDGIIIPNENIYCIDAGGSEQGYKNFKTYQYYLEDKLIENLQNLYGRHKDTALAYIEGSDYDQSTVLGKIVKNLQDKNSELLLYYNAGDIVKFKKSIYELNGGLNNADILTILFFKSNDLDKTKLMNFLNKCFDYSKDGNINDTYVKETIYKYLVK